MKVKRICKYCGKEEFTYLSESKKPFCGKECYGKWRSENIRGENHPQWNGGKMKRNCIICGKEFRFDKGDILRRKGKFEKRFCSVKCKGIWQSKNGSFKGKNNPNWKGGTTEKIQGLRISLEDKMKYWRIYIYERDKYTCQFCGKVGVYLNAHHIKPFIDIINKNHIKNSSEARKCDELWNLDNGITLCKECHKLVHRKKLII